MLIKCPECNKEISDKAKSCPNCGCPININTKYMIIITGYHDTDIVAYAGLTQTFNTNYEYEEAMNIFNYNKFDKIANKERRSNNESIYLFKLCIFNNDKK